MKVLILTAASRGHAAQRLAGTLKDLGHEVLAADPVAFGMRLSRRRPELFLGRRHVTDVGLVVPRLSRGETGAGLAVLRQLEQLGVTSLNSSKAIAVARDKLSALQCLVRHDIGLPPTAFVNRIDDVRFAIELVGGAPVVVKTLDGPGRGVMLAQTVDSAVSLVEALTDVQRPVLVQKFVEESRGTDVRAFVVGGEVIAAMRRRAAEGEFRASALDGSSVEAVRLGRETARAAVAAALALSLDVAGVDLLETADGPLVLDVNPSPGFERLEAATGVDVALACARFGLGRVGEDRTVRLA